MTLEIAFLLAIIGVMVFLFLTEKLPVELTAFAGLAILALTGYVAPDEAFLGFASPAVITMLSVFFLSAALLHTGVADAAARGIHNIVGPRENMLIVFLMLVVGLLSAFMNNVAATAVMMPAVAALAKQARIAPSRLYMPLAFGAILGGTTTLVGTPPNLLTGQVMQEQGIEPFSLFDFTPFGVVLLAAGIVYMLTIGRWLLPERGMSSTMAMQGDLAKIYRLRERLFSIRVPKGSALDGSTLRQARLGTALNVTVVAVLRGGAKELAPSPDYTIRGGDHLLVEGGFADVEHLMGVQGLQMAEARKVDLREATGVLTGLVLRIAEGGPQVGKTIRDLRIRERFGVLVAAIWRDGEIAHDRPGGLPLMAGDEVLLIGGREQIEQVAVSGELDIIEVGRSAVARLDGVAFELEVAEDSALAGATLRDSRIGELVGLTIIGVLRAGELITVAPDDRFEAGDRLLVTGESTRIASLIEVGHVEIEEEAPEADLESETVHVVEVVIAPRSKIAGRTLKDLDFRERYGLQVLAVWRHGEPVYRGLADIVLEFGEALLVQGPEAKIRLLAPDPDFLVLTPGLQEVRRTRKAPFALAGLGIMIGLVAAGLFPIQVAAFAAAVFVVLTGALTMEEAYRNIEWRAIFLVAAVLPVGIAMERSGAAAMIADGVVDTAGGLGPHVVLIALLLLSSALSQGLDGAPTVVLLAPVVFITADQLGISPRPLMMGVGLAASAAFLTPFSHKANLLVMGAGGYRVTDFIRVGSILTIVVLGILALMIPLILPF
jgi:di/tricarboxylate transporter